MEKSKILVIGATGRLGFDLATESLKSSHPTFALVRDSAFSDPTKSHKIQSLSDAGATILKGSLQDEASLVEAVKQVDVVICAVSAKEVLYQKLLIKVIKQVGSIKRFIPSEFGADPDQVKITFLDAGYNFYKHKAEIRRLLEAEGIPYTCISCNFFASLLLPSLVQPSLKAPPRDKVTIFGVGNTKETTFPENFEQLFIYSAFVLGDHTNFDIDPISGVSGTELYPQVKYTTISEILDTLV